MKLFVSNPYGCKHVGIFFCPDISLLPPICYFHILVSDKPNVCVLHIRAVDIYTWFSFVGIGMTSNYLHAAAAKFRKTLNGRQYELFYNTMQLK